MKITAVIRSISSSVELRQLNQQPKLINLKNVLKMIANIGQVNRTFLHRNLIKFSQSHLHQLNSHVNKKLDYHVDNQIIKPYCSKRPIITQHTDQQTITQRGHCSYITLKGDGKLIKKKSENYLEKKQFFELLQPVIGLEVHAQLNTKSKLFSNAGYDYKSMPNAHVAHFDCSFPGTLPVLNEEAVHLAIKTGLAFNCEISNYCTFDRKHYFYPDMPQGYQITQQRNPIATNGQLEFIVNNSLSESYVKKVKLKQIQLEQDSGKSVVDTKNNKVFIDLNRVGVGLMEFVFEPELYSAQEAVHLLRELHLTLKWLNVCSGKLEQGAFRIDSNISVHKPGEPLGTRVELKNLNSFKFIEEAIIYEIERQKGLLYEGGEVINETRHYNFKTKSTYSLRDKEVTQDYRFMPEPNLIPLRIYESREDQMSENENDKCRIYLKDLRIEIPKLPRDERELMTKNYNLTLQQTHEILFNEGFYKLFIYMMETNSENSKHNPIKLANFISVIVNSFLLERNIDFKRLKITYDFFDECYNLLIEDKITDGTVVELLNVKFDESSTADKSAKEYVDEYGWSKVEDQEIIRRFVREILNKYPKVARKYKNKKKKYSLFVLTEAVASKTKRTIPPHVIVHVIDEILLKDDKIETKFLEDAGKNSIDSE